MQNKCKCGSSKLKNAKHCTNCSNVQCVILNCPLPRFYESSNGFCEHHLNKYKDTPLSFQSFLKKLAGI